MNLFLSQPSKSIMKLLLYKSAKRIRVRTKRIPTAVRLVKKR